MIDHQGDWLVLLAMMLALLLLGIPVVRKHIGRLGRVILDRHNQPRDFDREAEELSRVLRRQQLCADLRRVEHLLATDTWMSARQPARVRAATRRPEAHARRLPSNLWN